MATDLFKFGSWATDDPSKVITLTAAPTTSNYSTFRKPGAISYPSGGSGYVITNIKWGCAGAGGQIFIGYADNDVGHNGAVPTNRVFLLGDSGLGGYATPLFMAVTVTPPVETPCYIGPVPVGKYLWMYSQTQQAGAILEGYEL